VFLIRVERAKLAPIAAPKPPAPNPAKVILDFADNIGIIALQEARLVAIA
jgi:hypothetical protein